MQRRYPLVILAFFLLLALIGCGNSTGSTGNPNLTQNDLANPFYEGTAVTGPAAEFELVDQKEVRISLSNLQGQVVVLAFLDPRCTDVCPLTAFHFRIANEAMGNDSDKVAFLAVNMNTEASSTSDTLAASRKWGVDDMANWHYLTGSAEDLRQVWRAYNVFAGDEKPGKPGEVQHTPGVYVIDQSGQKRWYISTAFDYRLSLSDIITRRVRELPTKP